jgi:hypothetical protein
MSLENQRDEENAILKQISSSFPAFMRGIKFVPANPDPPDFVGEGEGGERIGLKLTSWLNRDQTRAAAGRERMRADLQNILDWRNHPIPENFSSAVVMPRWGKRLRKADYPSFCDEFHRAARDIDNTWTALRIQHDWRPEHLRRGFDYCEYDLQRYPTLSKYVLSIVFFEPPEPRSTPVENSWIDFEIDGGVYDPKTSIQSLRDAIERKIDKYSGFTVSTRPSGRDRGKLYLLVYADPRRSLCNTPYQTPLQMRISPVEGLKEIAKEATEDLIKRHKIFDGVFLFYPLWNSQWLAQIWPSFQRLE